MKISGLLFILFILTGLYFWNSLGVRGNKFLTVGAWIKPVYDSNFPYDQIILSKWQLDDNGFANYKNYVIQDISEFSPGATAFAGGAFDGRYLYLSPLGLKHNYSGNVARYDTFSPFVKTASWSFYDISKFYNDAKGFGGSVFDGRFVYFVPDIGNGSYSGQVIRYDTKSPFKSLSSWEMFDMVKSNPDSKGFWGGIFDGRYIYFIPHRKSKGNYSGLVSRYDTKSPFKSSSSWSFFNSANLNSKSVGFVGAVFDGRYIYFIPNRMSDNDFSGQVTRYDTQSSFYSSSSWSFFDTKTINNRSKGFAGAVFDGKYIYFVPLFANVNKFSGMVARYDTSSVFESHKAWEFFDVSAIVAKAKGFVGGIFDGRYIYLIPFRYGDENSNNPQSSQNMEDLQPQTTDGFGSILIQLDPKRNFTQREAWRYFDLAGIDKDLKGFWGGIFDGRYIYYFPQKISYDNASGKIVRFDTTGDKLSSFRLLYSQSNQSGSFSGTPFGPKFEINSNKGNYSISANMILEKDKWYLITGTFDGKSLKIYINGKLISENRNLPNDILINNIKQVSFPVETNCTMHGIITDEFYILQTLKSEEINNMYQSGKKEKFSILHNQQTYGSEHEP